jgi:hypothetical protein
VQDRLSLSERLRRPRRGRRALARVEPEPEFEPLVAVGIEQRLAGATRSTLSAVECESGRNRGRTTAFLCEEYCHTTPHDTLFSRIRPWYKGN